MPRGSCWPPLRQNGEDNWVVPASHGSAPSNRIWNITILRSPKQQIWLRTALCGGWCRRMALRNRQLHARNDDDDDSKNGYRLTLSSPASTVCLVTARFLMSWQAGRPTNHSMLSLLRFVSTLSYLIMWPLLFSFSPMCFIAHTTYVLSWLHGVFSNWRITYTHCDVIV